MTLDERLLDARRKVKLWQKKVDRLADKKCAKDGHIKGAGAWTGVFYCRTCGCQIAEHKFTPTKGPTP